ncbi:methyl-accepting chemotaxis protein [Jeongeupia chitinilytica]|uniref:Aerotaxis receptor Aer n=1 Tax=Jeongeupia chitinilytica TaxID=1041641 RepID=A0ABQ3GXC4_9NEIS|nr:PAS domain-containing methyl-accepting chemotaxis protein [Jeongeupia chitinilytica]GHD58216.1 aerotaxis receptor Aer [Jeongeupia chitinilytica]
MRRNEPVSGQEIRVDPRRPLVSKTDLKGRITYANPAFVDISGFSRDELLGSPHNLVRHPDMPPAAFADMWQTLQADQPWRGIVKNRAKSGDHYWVEAFVTPLLNDGQKIGYMSVRNAPSPAQIRDAERLYAAANAGRATLAATRWPHTLALEWRLALVLAVLLMLSGAALWIEPRYCLVAATAVAVAGWLWLRSSWKAPLAAASEAVGQLAEGNFRFETRTRAPRECARLLLQIEAMRISLRAVIADVVSAADTVGTRAGAVAAASVAMIGRAQSQSDGVSGVAAALEQLTVSVDEIQESTRQSAQHADHASGLARRGSGEMRAAQGATQQVVGVVDEARATLDALSDAVGSINTVTQTIREIAEQTNLLALNAAIEAARAGEQGRGFAVVADEVRKLAERTSQSTGDISATIATMAERSALALASMAQAVDAVQRGTAMIDDCEQTLQQICDASSGVERAAHEVDGMLRQQSQAAGDVAASMERISTLTEQNGVAIAGMSETAEALSAVADELHTMLQQFDKSR